MLEAKQRDRNYDYIFKIVIVGDTGVGKSQLLSRFARNEFSLECRNTIGVEFATKVMEIDGRLVCVQIWDTAGDERYRAVTGAYYRGAVGALIVYDITRLPTFENVSKWLDEVNHYRTGGASPKPGAPISTGSQNSTKRKENEEEISSPITTMLVGNKLDMRQLRTVPTADVQLLARNKKVFFTETSALDSTNVEKAFSSVIHEIYEKVRQSELRQVVDSGAGLEAGSQALKITTKSSTMVTVKDTQPKKLRKPSMIANECKEDVKGWCWRVCC